MTQNSNQVFRFSHCSKLHSKTKAITASLEQSMITWSYWPMRSFVYIPLPLVIVQFKTNPHGLSHSHPDSDNPLRKLSRYFIIKIAKALVYIVIVQWEDSSSRPVNIFSSKLLLTRSNLSSNLHQELTWRLWSRQHQPHLAFSRLSASICCWRAARRAFNSSKDFNAAPCWVISLCKDHHLKLSGIL